VPVVSCKWWRRRKEQRIVVVVVGVANATCIGYLAYKKLNSNSLSLSLSLLHLLQLHKS
jgi:hypothetical protein